MQNPLLVFGFSKVGQTDLVFGVLFHHGSLLGLCM